MSDRSAAARILTHGNWPRIADCNSSGNDKGIFVAVDYAYRNQAMVSDYCYLTGGLGTSMEGYVPLPYTNPRVQSETGCPPFKTQRRLGARALASDDFWKAETSRPWVGVGIATSIDVGASAF